MIPANRPPALTIRAIRCTGVEAPMSHPLATSRGLLAKAPLLLIDLETDEGITGRAYIWSYFREAMTAISSVMQVMERETKGRPVAPLDLWAQLYGRFELIGVQGIVRMAMAGFDMAAWDALATGAGLPLATFLGAKPRPIRAYNSCGLGLTQDRDALAAQAVELLDRGFGAVKLRLGYPTLKDDLAAVHAVKKRIPSHVALMVDYNQALTLAEAMERGRALDQEDLCWLEEPIRHDDYKGAAMLARALSVPIQLGENFSEAAAMAVAIEAGASDYVMPDLERIGGVTGWQRAAALASGHRIEMSSHLYPEISAHLLCATPTCHFLEYVDWADKILQEPVVIKDGHAHVSQRPGNGIAWDETAVERYRV
jgi:mandelate racemase